jgi:hypothetical protein
VVNVELPTGAIKLRKEQLAIGTSLPTIYLVSRCMVWLRHLGQYFFSSKRAWSLRRFFSLV